MDIPTIYGRKVRLRAEDHYTHLLEPVLAAKFGAVGWPAERTLRLLLATKLHNEAVAHLLRDHGVPDPRPKSPNMFKMLERLAPVPSASATVIPFHDYARRSSGEHLIRLNDRNLARRI